MPLCPQCSSQHDEAYRFCCRCGFPVGDVVQSGTNPMIGRTLAGGYVILDVIGEGAMGKVYRAEQRALRRTVAIKIVHPRLLSDTAVTTRFLNEARAISQINHPHVVGVIDFGKTPEEVPFIVMEYLRGKCLDRVLNEEGLLAPRRITALATQVLAALGEAHALGLVHRDLKPANVMVERLRNGSDFAKVLDFGLARMLAGADSSPEKRLTGQGVVFGTPAYMAPEQAAAGEVDARSDLYAVGAILYELISGKAPFEDQNSYRLLLARLKSDPIPVNLVANRTLPRGLAEATMRALAREPAMRFQSADEFAAALAEVDASASAKDDRPTMPAPPRSAPCPTCGSPVPEGKRFCGECGSRTSSPTPACSVRLPPETGTVPPPSEGMRRRRSTVLHLHAPSLDDDTGWLQGLRLGHRQGLIAASLSGDPGSGRTTSLRKFLQAARSGGDVAIELGPDPTGAPRSGYGLEQLISALLRAGDEKRERLSWSSAPTAVRKFVQDLLSGDAEGGRAQADEYASAAVESLRWALHRGVVGALTGRVVIGLDDFDRMDGVTRNAISDLVNGPCDELLMVVATHATSWLQRWPHGALRTVRGLSLEHASEVLRVTGDAAAPALASCKGPTVTPLHLEQLVRYLLEGGTEPPTTTADLMTARMQALVPEARTVLQAMAVLGDDASIEDIQSLLPDHCDFERALTALAAAGMVDRSARGLRWAHPMLREVAASCTPASARRELYARACDLFEDRAMPIEVSALLAFQAERDIEAMFLLEQVAERAMTRGDDEGCIEALRCGLAAAQRDSSRGDTDRPSESVLVFGRKLGDALLHAGRLAEADTLLRGLIELVGADSPDGIQIMRGIARVERAERQSGDGQSLCIASDPDCKAKA